MEREKRIAGVDKKDISVGKTKEEKFVKIYIEERECWN